MSITLTKRPAATPAYTDGNTGEDVYVEYRAYSTFEYRVPAGTPVTREHKSRNYRTTNSDPRSTFPNMEVTDGSLVIPITDIVDEIVARAEPVDLALALWQHDEVRAHFIECAAERYSQGGVGDGDRRLFLAKVQHVVHSVALDKLADAMTGIERETIRKSAYYQEVARINDTLRNLDIKVSRSVKNDDGTWGSELVLLQMRVDPDAEMVSGKGWQEAREFWRKEVLRQFPLPAQEPKPAEQGGPDL